MATCTDAVTIKFLNVGRKVGENSADSDKMQSDQHIYTLPIIRDLKQAPGARCLGPFYVPDVKYG